MDSPLQLIVGLGNPGKEYERSRHNAGADFVSELARSLGTQLTPESKFHGLTARARVDGQDLRLLIPTTFMNRSGRAIGALAQFFKIPPEAILVAHDELDLPPGTARLKHGGGHGGHNGLRDTIRALGNSSDFNRLRLGIGHPGSASQVVSYVLKKASVEDQRLIEEAIDRAISVMPLAAKGQWGVAMNHLHTKVA